ncbi:MAG TPA: DUF1206 domain-containing protein [Ktedonobacteraceae bacterium]|nr:DUF1206 domain-containing protein [Ktedonobacteraceae bacterium]
MRNSPVANRTREAEQTARQAATSPLMVMLARLGYAVKGILYVIIGILAGLLGFGHGGSATDQRGALGAITALPFGKFLLGVVTVGLFAFGLWSIIQGIFDTEGQGKKAKGIIARIGYAAVGVSYIVLGVGALRVVTGSGSAGQSSTSSTQDWTATLLKQPFGQALVVIVGLVVLAIAVYLYMKAYKARFLSSLNLGGLRASSRKTIINLGRAGYAALGVVFTIISIFLIVAAVQFDPKKAVGLDGALKELLLQPFGPILLVIVALGLIAYGLYSFAEARYRRIGR